MLVVVHFEFPGGWGFSGRGAGPALSELERGCGVLHEGRAVPGVRALGDMGAVTQAFVRDLSIVADLQQEQPSA